MLFAAISGVKVNKLYFHNANTTRELYIIVERELMLGRSALKLGRTTSVIMPVRIGIENPMTTYRACIFFASGTPKK
jgi:hypothetical protein